MMEKLGELRELRFRLLRPENPSHVKSMALICFAAATLLLFGLIFNADNLPVSKETRAISTALTAGAGLLYWTFARHFRAWMLHAIITLGLVSGCYGLSQMDSSMGSAMAILTILWTCLLIGTIYRPAVTRAYGVMVWIGIALALTRSSVGVAENVMLAFSFGLTITVTMEILSRTSTRLRDEATHDPLTGLLNRKGLAEAVVRTERFAQRQDEPVAVVLLDLDDFKAVNDQEGHLAGDRLLASCADAWARSIRPQDVLARSGGDEFVLLLVGADTAEAEATLGRIAATTPAQFSYGVAVAAPGESIAAKVQHADARLIEAKSRRRRASGDSEAAYGVTT